MRTTGGKQSSRASRGLERSIRATVSETRNQIFDEIIRSIPRGTVATYGQVAEAAGFPGYHRAVARFLGAEHYLPLPWQRVVGAGGEIKVSGKHAALQRALLESEGVTFAGRRVDMKLHTYDFGG